MGSNASRIPSPTRLNAKTASSTNTSGNSIRYFNGKDGPYGGIPMPSGPDVFVVRAQGIQGGMLWRGLTVVTGGNSVGR